MSTETTLADGPHATAHAGRCAIEWVATSPVTRTATSLGACPRFCDILHYAHRPPRGRAGPCWSRKTRAAVPLPGRGGVAPAASLHSLRRAFTKSACRRRESARFRYL